MQIEWRGQNLDEVGLYEEKILLRLIQGILDQQKWKLYWEMLAKQKKN